TISLTEVADPSAFGVVPTREDGQVIAFVEKPPPGNAPSTWINAGTYVLEPSFLERIPPRLNVSVERETFPRMLEQPGLLYGYKSDAYWLDIGTPENYVRGNLDVLVGRTGLPPAPNAREVAEGIWVQGDATLEPDAVVAAPMLVGEGARVEAGARVRGSVLGPRTVVERGAELDGAVLHAGARVSNGSIVRQSAIGADSVLKPEVTVGDFTIVGAGATVASGTQISAGRVPADRA
ncbi:MAG: NDP-sugar synthase, partial [Actinomycetota bacterium]|nr:NDP-sugar synthase [Actinomycetota bacterium]